MRLQNAHAEGLAAELQNSSISRYIKSENLLSILDASSIGVVISDRQFRFKALNRSMAEIHSVPMEALLGHSIHKALGSLAEKILPAWEKVFSSGKPLPNLDVTGRLPKRSSEGRWIKNLFPLKDRRGRVTQVGGFIIEIALSPIPISPSSSPAGKVTSVASDHASSPDRRHHALLSHREQEVLRLLAEGESNKGISSILAISVRTVETYRARLMLKLDANRIADLVHYAIRNHIVTL